MADPFKLEASLAAKVGSILVHIEEATSDDGHPFDMEAVKALIRQPDVVAWIASLQKIALVPVKRRPDGRKTDG